MFQVPNGLIRPASEAQFHRSADAVLRTMAEDLGQPEVSIASDSNATQTSSMGSVITATPSVSLEVYMDAFGPREAPDSSTAIVLAMSRRVRSGCPTWMPVTAAA